MKRGLVQWFEKRKEQAIRKGIDYMLSLVEKCDSALREQFEKWFSGEVVSAEPVHMHEHEADIVRRKLIDEIEESALAISRKGAFLRLVRQIDKIADWTLAAARALTLVAAVQGAKDLPEGFLSRIRELLDCNTRNIQAITRASMYLLSGDPEAALAGADESERLEETADALRDSLKAMVFEGKLPVSPLIGVGLLEVIESIENVADSCEDLGDEIRASCASISRE